MNNPVIHHPASYITMPWRNGMGKTTELIKHTLPKGSEFTWRISMADVNEDGPFSLFDGYDRTLLLLTGDGITLVTDRQQPVILANPLDIARFRGDDQTIATLHGGPITDFNIMTNRLQCQAQVDCGQENSGDQSLKVNCDELLIFSVNSQIQIGAENWPTVNLPGQHLLQVKNIQRKLHINGPAQFIAIQIRYLPEY